MSRDAQPFQVGSIQLINTTPFKGLKRILPQRNITHPEKTAAADGVLNISERSFAWTRVMKYRAVAQAELLAHCYFPDGHRSNQRSPESMDCRSLLPNTILLAPVTLHTIFYATRKGARH